ncbi:AMP-binding protein [Rhizobium calliandrae]|uniref:aminoglycoside N(3)-acetyltransferase n=1 Tax=Rhizobium calliandrae TaxID=1312182 RepID=A0ABT7KP89_9HYPH|nr:AMP-binding protein [Rhizobium calliandrae]MDL2410424.1 AMP-binding protein [Rhizobium calliandrae]
MTASRKYALTPTLSGLRRPLRFGNDNIADVIAKTLHKFPAKTAVRTKDGDVTYGELATLASRLKERFEAIGVRPGDAAVVKLPRSIDLVTAILATQILGIAFVPVDPSESDERVGYILSKTNAIAIVSHDSNGSLCVKRTHLRGGKSRFTNIAYIMHTSGSTGRPKAVPVSQAALLNLIDWYIDMIDFSERVSIAQLSRPTFDFSIPEFIVPFATGGTIVLPSTQLGAQIVQTTEFLIQSGTNVIQMVPTLLRCFLGTLERLPDMAERFTHLKYVISGGEPLPDSVRRRFYSILPNATLVNSYGPTECCVAVNYYYCPRGEADLPMFTGQPACNIDFFVLDENQCNVGLEAEGELWVGGAQTSESYIADECQSKLHFMPHVTTNGKQVLYRTGDYVVASDEHGLRMLGRKDDQIKYRGVRLEKGEITSAIDRTGLCADSAVILLDRDDDTGQDLVCIVTPANADVDQLRRRLSKALPNDRVPRLVVPLDILPFTSNGKLDQRALERTAKKALQATVKDAAPHTEKATASPLNHLLLAINAVTGKWVSPSLKVQKLDIDSLKFLELQVKLAEIGLMFNKDVYLEQNSTIEHWARELQPVDRSVFQAGAVRKGEHAAEFRDGLEQIINCIETQTPSIVVLHSSLAAIRNLTPSDVASILLQAIERLATSSTIIIPAFTLSYCDTRQFHFTETKSETGVLADLVMRELSGGRTKHPAYSMVVTGPKTRELCDAEWWQRTPFGDDSIFEFISRAGGFVMGLGTSVATHVHRCEMLARVPYMKTINIDGLVDFGTGPLRVSSSVYVRDIAERPEYRYLARDVARDIRELKDVTRDFELAGTYARLVAVRDMEAVLVRAMRVEPYGFLREEAREEAQRAYPISQRVA